jgi:hypothetical protein
MMNWIPERSGELLSSAMVDGTVIVSPQDGRMSVVNEVGAFVWELIDGQNSVETIVNRVTDNFEVPIVQAEADVLTFLQALAERELVTMRANA